MDSKQGFNACLRCKARKIKCDREMPKCTNCEKARKPCLTTDPASGRQVPRSYLNHLETRVQQLEKELEMSRARSGLTVGHKFPENALPNMNLSAGVSLTSQLLSSIFDDMITDSPRISSAVRSKDQTTKLEIPLNTNPTNPHTNLGTNQQAENISNEQANSNKPWSLPVDLPSKNEAEKMIRWYFEQCNSRYPILHREQFIIRCFEPVYGKLSPNVQLCSKHTALDLQYSSTEPETGTFYRRWVDCGNSLAAAPEPHIQACLFFLYITFALGCVTNFAEGPETNVLGTRYFSAALTYYSSVFGSYRNGEKFTTLQAVLLLTLYGIMHPYAPGSWYYSVGDAIRMCIDMGLYNESKRKTSIINEIEIDSRNKNLETLSEYEKDMRRRLFWCAYCMDRFVCVSLGRPTSIPDEYIDCALPTPVDDSWLSPDNEEQKEKETMDTDNDRANSTRSSITSSGSLSEPSSLLSHFTKQASPLHSNQQKKGTFSLPDRPSYKWVFLKIIGIRRIQYRIRSRLYDQVHFESVSVMRAIRDEFAIELEEWYSSLPWDKSTYNFDWDTDLFEAQYLYTRMLLYRNSPSIPEPDFNESKILLDACFRSFKIYEKFNGIGYIVCPWIVVHGITQTATACIYAMYKTDALHHTCDIDGFEASLISAMDIMNQLRVSINTAGILHDSILEMSKAVIEYLRDPSRKKRKVSDETANDMTSSGSFSEHSHAETTDAEKQFQNYAQRQNQQNMTPPGLINIAPRPSVPPVGNHYIPSNNIEQPLIVQRGPQPVMLPAGIPYGMYGGSFYPSQPQNPQTGQAPIRLPIPNSMGVSPNEQSPLSSAGPSIVMSHPQYSNLPSTQIDMPQQQHILPPLSSMHPSVSESPNMVAPGNVGMIPRLDESQSNDHRIESILKSANSVFDGKLSTIPKLRKPEDSNQDNTQRQ